MTCATCPETNAGAKPRPLAALVLLALLASALFTGFVALGTWQVHRRAWKLDLIARVEQRLRAPPVAAPGPGDWPAIHAGDAYRRLYAEGAFLDDRETLVQAVTEHGPGWWVMTPLRTREGFIVIVNRGFIDAGHRDPHARRQAPAAPARVKGLLRLSEPGGGFLRHNDAAAQRWYSRDVAAIAAAQGLPAENVAPYFIDADADADAASGADSWPLGGLTVVRFHNSHLVYALTWYTLALMVAGAAVLGGRQEWALRRRRTAA